MVYVIDDSVIIRIRVKAMLEEIAGVGEVSEAGDVPEALRDLDHIQPDVVIVDIQLPSGNGFEILKRLQVQESRALKIMLTNFPDQQFREKAYALGADYFFDKSREFESVITVVQDHFRHSSHVMMAS